MSDSTTRSDAGLAILKSHGRPRRALITGFPVAIDACVLVNPTLRDFILWAAHLALYRPVWSKDILDEVRRTLVKFGLHSDRIEYTIGKMTTAFPEAEVEGYEPLIQAMTNDEKDRHVLAAAVVAKAQLIVTNNLRDFPEEALRPYRIELMEPDEFLRDLLDVDPERMLEVLTTIATSRKMPPKSIDELLEALERNCCAGFAEDLRAALKCQYGDK